MDVLSELDDDRLGGLLREDRFFWLDLTDPGPEALEALGERFGLRPAAVEDSREWGQLPKVDRYGDHLLLVFFTADTLEPVSEPREVHVYLSGGWMVTVRRSSTPLDALCDTMRDSDPDSEDEDLIVYRLLDALAYGWDPVVKGLDDRWSSRRSSWWPCCGAGGATGCDPPVGSPAS